MAARYRKNPVTVFVGILDLRATHSVTQQLFEFQMMAQILRELLLFLRQLSDIGKVIFFMEGELQLTECCTIKDVMVQAIHRSRTLRDREQALTVLKTVRVRILIAMDVSGYDLSIDDVAHVFNYNFPWDMEV